MKKNRKTTNSKSNFKNVPHNCIPVNCIAHCNLIVNYLICNSGGSCNYVVCNYWYAIISVQYCTICSKINVVLHHLYLTPPPLDACGGVGKVNGLSLIIVPRKRPKTLENVRKRPKTSENARNRPKTPENAGNVRNVPNVQKFRFFFRQPHGVPEAPPPRPKFSYVYRYAVEFRRSF